MKRIEFRLSMPGRGSANGEWSGAGRNHLVVKTLTDKAAAELLPGGKSRSWYHSWSDGWTAQITARLIPPRERRPKSDGFLGYDWMVTNILLYGQIEAPAKTPREGRS